MVKVDGAAKRAIKQRLTWMLAAIIDQMCTIVGDEGWEGKYKPFI